MIAKAPILRHMTANQDTQTGNSKEQGPPIQDIQKEGTTRDVSRIQRKESFFTQETLQGGREDSVAFVDPGDATH